LTALEEARHHLATAREFLDAAETSRDLGLHNAAASDAVISAINSKDAVCLALTGRTGNSDNHARAVEELKRSGPVGAELASYLSRLLNLKTRSQYASRSVSAVDASKAVGWASRLHATAEGVVRDR
jgi:cobalamin-dependent methionine synthase I